MASVSFITTCKGRLTHLMRSLPLVVRQSDLSCIVVDYACPDGTAAWVRANYPQVRVVTVPGAAGFNVAHARNLGASISDSPWLAFFDADILWAENFAATVVPTLRPGAYFRAMPITGQSWGSLICRHDDFAKAGGYDESFDGWGGEDDDLMIRLRSLGLLEAGFPGELISEIPHEESARVRFHEVKDRRLQSRINTTYIQVKYDLIRMLGSPLSAEARKSLFQHVRQGIRMAFAEGRAVASIDISLPAQSLVPPATSGQADSWQQRRKINYTVDLPRSMGSLS